MTLSELFIQINSSFRGSDDEVPASGTPDYVNWLAATNRKIQEWARDSKQTWQSNFLFEKPNETGTVATVATTALTGTSTYFTDYRVGDKITVSGETERTIATIPSNTSLTVTVAFSNTASAKTFTHKSIIATAIQSYNLHRRLLMPSDKVFVTTTTQDLEYTLGKPQERERYDNEVYLSSRDPQILTFYDDIESTHQSVGGTLKVPGYYVPAELTTATDIIPVDDPYWLIYATASLLAGNDITYSDKSPDLNAQANALYSQMVSNNRRGQNNNPRLTRTNVNRIQGF